MQAAEGILSGATCHPDKLLSVEAESSNWDCGASWWSSFHLRTTLTIYLVIMGAVISGATWQTDKLLSVAVGGAVKQFILLPFSCLANQKLISFQYVIFCRSNNSSTWIVGMVFSLKTWKYLQRHPGCLMQCLECPFRWAKLIVWKYRSYLKQFSHFLCRSTLWFTMGGSTT